MVDTARVSERPTSHVTIRFNGEICSLELRLEPSHRIGASSGSSPTAFLWRTSDWPPTGTNIGVAEPVDLHEGDEFLCTPPLSGLFL